MQEKINEEQIRLNKYIASTGLCSRRKADEFIGAEKVKVNGKIITELGYKVSKKDKIIVDGKLLAEKKLQYAIFYKPSGYITTMSDEKGRKTIYDVLPEECKSLKPAGRLDKDTTGLLFLSNDGDLINDLTHPSIKIPKVYSATLQGKITKQDLKKLADGIEIEKGKIAYAQADLVDFVKGNSLVEITLYQGMNRQIRKMADAINHPVISLKRLSHGMLNLNGLKKGEFVYLKPSQIREFKNYVKKAKLKNFVSDKIKKEAE